MYDVQWSPIHPALFAAVDGTGRLDLWNLNNDTEVQMWTILFRLNARETHVLLSPNLPCRYRQQVHIPNQWRHWTVCGGRIQGTRFPWVTMMVTCSFMTLARWENSKQKMSSYGQSNIRKFPLLQYLLPKGTVTKFKQCDHYTSAHLPLPLVNINTYFSLRAKCWLRGGVGGQFPINV